MDIRTEIGELHIAWRALSGTPDMKGWRTIPIATDNPCKLRAGIRFPDNEESLLIGFSSPCLAAITNLPKGFGFSVFRVDLDSGGGESAWIALCRQKAGNLELFTLMAEDIVSFLSPLAGAEEPKLLDSFLARIRAWQDFMKRGKDHLLGHEAEVGLFGELEVLRILISAGLPVPHAIEAWQGPLGNSQDFVLGTGAIEVKSTVSSACYVVKIDSLDQLDDSYVRPLFLVALRISLDSSGRTLPEQICELRNLISAQRVPLDYFNNRLLHAGFHDAAVPHYSRRFSLNGNMMLRIAAHFPRYTRGNVVAAVKSMRYEIDLEMVGIEGVSIHDALTELGVV